MNGFFSAWQRGFWILWVVSLALAAAFAFPTMCYSADPPAIPEPAARAMQDRDYAAAVEAIEAALTQPDQPHDYLRYLKGRALALDGQFEAAVEAFEQMAEQSPDSPWARRARFAAGWASAADRRFEQAAIIYRAEAEKLLDPERKHQLAQAIREFGDAFYSPTTAGKLPDFAAALDYYQEALKVGFLPEVQAATEFRVARCRQELKQTNRAAALFAAFQADYPGHPLVIEAALREGQCLLDESQPEQARRVWLDLLAAHEDDPSPWIAEAAYRVSHTWGMPRPASDADLRLGVATLDDYLARFPAHQRAAQAHVDIALAWMTRTQPENAALWLNRLLADARYQTEEAIPHARVLLGQVYRDQDRFEQAIRVWREYLTSHPADAQWSEVQQRVIDAEYLLALDKHRDKQYDAARQLLSEFIARYPLDPRNPGILVLFGRMNYEQQRWQAAIDDWQRVVSKHPHTNEASYAQYMIGAVLQRHLDQPSEAIDAYGKVTSGSHASDARAAIERLTATSMTVVTERVFRSHEIPAIKLTTRNVPEVTVRVYRIDAEAYFRKSHRLDGIEDLDIGLIAPDVTFRFSIPEYAEHREFENRISLPEPEMGAGTLVATVSTETLEAATLVLRSDLEIVVKASASDVFVWAQNMQNGQPWPGTRLLISDGRGLPKQAVTGDDGVFHWDRLRTATTPDAEEVEPVEFAPPAGQRPNDSAGENVSVLAVVEGHVASNLLSLEGLETAATETDQGYLYTDRPTYRPGEQVFVRGCIRRNVGQADSAQRGRDWMLDVFDPRQRTVWQQPVSLSEFGTLNAEFPLPPIGVSGRYRIVVRNGAGQRYEAAFHVHAARQEPVRLQIDLDRRVAYHGEQIEGTIRAEFPDGTPLQGAQVCYQLADQPAITIATDDRGHAPLRLSTRLFAESRVLTISARLPQWDVAAEADVLFAMQGFSVDLQTARTRYLAGETFEVNLLTRDPEANPVAQSLRLKVFKLSSRRGKVIEHPHQEVEIRTDGGDGRGSTAIKLDEAGRYRLRAEGTDDRGTICSGQTTVVISGEHDRHRLLMLADRRDYRAGETCEVNLFWREPPTLALVTFETSRVLDYRLVPLNTGANQLAMVLTGDLAPDFRLVAAAMTGDGRLHQASARISVRHELRVSLDVRRPDAAGAVEPGGPVEIGVTTRDAQGKPVAAEVSLALVEGGLLEPSSNAWPQIGPVFRGQSQPWSVRTGSSIAFAYSPATRWVGTKIPAGPALYQDAARRTWRAPGTPTADPFDDSASFELPEYTAADPAASFLRLVAWMEQAEVPFEELLDAEQKPEPESEQGPGAGGFFGLDSSQDHRQRSETSSDPFGMPRPTTAPDPVDPFGAATVDPFASRKGSGVVFGQAAFHVVDRCPKMTPDPVAYRPPESDTNYLAGAYWNPAVVTDAEGRASIVIALPDRPAVWQLRVQGVTADSLAGDASLEITATKDLYGQWKLPATLTDGDVANVLALVHNRLPAEQTVEVILTAQIGSRRVEQRKTVQVAAAGIAELLFPILLGTQGAEDQQQSAREAVSEVEFQLELIAGPHRDSVHQTVPVHPLGESREFGSCGVASGDAMVSVAPPASLPLDSPRLRIVVHPTMEAALTDSLLDDRSPVAGSPTERAATDLMSAIAVQELTRTADGEGDAPAREVDTRIRAALAMLVSTQLESSGGWSWSGRGGDVDRYVTAQSVWALGLARQAGYAVPRDVLQNALRCTAAQWTALPDSDYDGKAMLLHARSVAGQQEFEQANGLYRMRASLSIPALLHLALAFAEMDRGATSAELLDMVAEREQADQTASGDDSILAPNHSPSEIRALHCLALMAVGSEQTQMQQSVDRMLVDRVGDRWAPDRATGPAMLALCRWFAGRRSASEPYRLTVSVNGQSVKVLELDATAGGQTVDVPAELLVPGEHQVAFELDGQGRYAYRVLLSGTVAADRLSSTTARWTVQQHDSPPPLLRDGQPVPRGFANLKRNVPLFRNELHQLPTGRLGEVELRLQRSNSVSDSSKQLEYLIVREPLPAGTRVVESSVRGSFEWFEQQPGAVTFYIGNRSQIGTITYALQGSVPGSYRASPTQVYSAYRTDQTAFTQPKTLTVLPLGEASSDPYRLTPQELMALGEQAFRADQWQQAGSMLTELLTYAGLRDDVYRQAILMLLDVELERNEPEQIVRYFEIIRDKWPQTTISFAKLLRIGAAYQAILEHERSFLGYRALVESLFTTETGVPGALAARGHFLPSVDVMTQLLSEYPPEPYTAAARFGLAQQLAAKALESDRDAELKGAGIGRTELLVRAGQLLDALLVDHPDDPAADQVAFAAASNLLELGRFEQAAAVGEQYAARYPDSPLLDSFWYLAGYGHFVAGQPEPARQLLGQVVASRPIDPTTGRPSDSVNKWPAIYLLGQIEHSQGRVAEAVRQYRLVEDRFSDARQSIASLLRKTVKLPATTVIRPGQPVAVPLEYRNPSTCEIKVYRIDLLKYALSRQGRGNTQQVNLAGIHPLYEATVDLGNDQQQSPQTQNLVLDVRDEGAYLIVCRTDQQFVSGLLLITPLEIEVYNEADTNEVRVTVTEVLTDQPVYDARVHVTGSAMQHFVTGGTDRRGLFVARPISGHATAIAQVGKNRFAFWQDPAVAAGVTVTLHDALWHDATPMSVPSELLSSEIIAAVESRRSIGVVVSGPGASAAEQQIERILDTRTALQFKKTPLEDVAATIASLHRIPVWVDTRSLDDMGLGSDVPVSFAVENTTLRTALRRLLRPLDLTFVVREDGLTITTPEDAEMDLTTVLYPVEDLITFRNAEGEEWEDFDSLIHLITVTIALDSWDVVGGPGSIEAFQAGKVGTIVVSQTQEVHRDVAGLLEKLRRVAAQADDDGRPPLRERSAMPEGWPGAGMGGMGGMGGGMGGMGGGFGVPADAQRPFVTSGIPVAPDEGGLLKGLEAMRGRLQRGQVDKLQRMYDAGMGGGMGGMGAGGFF